MDITKILAVFTNSKEGQFPNLPSWRPLPEKKRSPPTSLKSLPKLVETLTL